MDTKIPIFWWAGRTIRIISSSGSFFFYFACSHCPSVAKQFPKGLATEAAESAKRVRMEGSSKSREHHLEFKPQHSQGVLLESPWKRRESHTLQTTHTVLPVLFQGKTGRNSEASHGEIFPHKAQMRWSYNQGHYFIGSWGQIISLICHLYDPNSIYITPANDGTLAISITEPLRLSYILIIFQMYSTREKCVFFSTAYQTFLPLRFCDYFMERGIKVVALVVSSNRL